MALNCKITKPVAPICDTTVSGIQLMAIANWKSTFTASASGMDCLIDTIDLDGENFYSLAIATDSGSASCEVAAGANKDAKALLHTVNGVFNRIDCDMIGDYKNYLLGTVVVAFMTKNREVFLAGWDNGLTSEAFNFTTGLAEADQAGITFSYTGIQPNFFLKVKDWATIEALM
jgi:hypothetical protein